jgi:dolichol-phosphate mannosyltransferase
MLTSQRSIAPAQPVRVSVDSAAPIGSGRRARTVSVVVPTYREAANVPVLVQQLAEIRASQLPKLDVWIMDDQSKDGTREAVDSLGLDWVHLVERDGPRGLSPAVLDGIARSGGETIVVMDADLSHPPSAIPALLDALDAGAEFAVGSRYVPGGSTDDDWGLFRKLNSGVATMLARPIAKVRDPMSGFFAFDRAHLSSSGTLSPLGYKIGLELIVKCRARRIAEVPIHFADRTRGTSKLSFVQQLQFIEHLRRLYWFKLFGRRAAANQAPK